MNMSENKKEITARYPSEYIYIMVGLTGIGFFCLLICSLIAPPEQKEEIISLILGISVLLLILSIGFKRYKIILSRDEIIEVPILGKKKQIKFEEIESVKIRRSKAISIFGKKKKIYIVEILLPKGLITSYNKELPYLLEMEGKAEIITDDLSLLERFLLPIKKVLKENL